MSNSSLQRTRSWGLCSPTLCGTLLLLLAPGCSKSKSEEKPPAPVVVPSVATQTGSEPVVSADDAKKLADQQKVKDAIAALNEEIPVELARWNDEMKVNTRALVATRFKTPSDAIRAVLASPHRMPGNADRDPYRHPLETLTFFGLTPTSRVVEMGIGRGWYTEILAPVVASEGQFTGGGYDAAGPDDQMRTVYGLRQQALFAKSEDLFGKAKTFDLGAETVTIGEPGSADLVLAIREMHNWQRRDTIDANLKAIVDVLAPGGSFGVVQHRAQADAKPEESAEQGYLPEAWLIAKVEAAGLKLVEKSEINANPKDTKDYADGVWTLPPNLRAGDADKEKYAAIGESDRMTLRFEKPAAE